MEIVEGHIAIAKPDNVASWDVDPYSEDYLLDSTPRYRELRERGDFVYIPKYSILATGHHKTVNDILARQDKFVSSRGTGINDYSVRENWRKPSIILEVDPPYHTKTRTAMMRSMTPAVVNGLKPMFQAEADQMVDALIGKASFDSIPDLAETYSIGVFPRAVGLKAVDRRKIIDYGIMTFNANGPDNERTRDWMKRGADTVPWITDSCKREALNPDGMGESIYKQVDSGQITEEEAAMLVRAFLAAGMDATIAAVGITLWSLATNPGEFEKLKADPSLARSAFDEALRLNAPVHHFYRTCIEETEVAGVVIPANAKVMLSYASANLDPEKWDDPDRYDITRKSAGMMTFGTGLHSCIGQMIARAEGEAVVNALARKVSTITLTGEPVWRPNNFVRSLVSLPVKFD